MKDIYQDIDLHGNRIDGAIVNMPSNDYDIAPKKYVDQMVESVSVTEFKEGDFDAKIYIRNLNPYKTGAIDVNNGWEMFILTTTNFGDRPNNTTPSARLITGQVISIFTNVTPDASLYGFKLLTNQNLYRLYKDTQFNLGVYFLRYYDYIRIEQYFSATGDHPLRIKTKNYSLNEFQLKFLPVVSKVMAAPITIPQTINTPEITDLGIYSMVYPDLNKRVMSTRNLSTLTAQNYYVILPENYLLPNNDQGIGFYYYVKDNNTNEIVLDKTYIDLSNSERITWCGFGCDVVYLELGYFNVPNDDLTLVVESEFI